MFAPQAESPHQIPEAFRASLNRFKECVPKEASKRLFWITDNPRPLSHANEEESRRIKICMTLCKDLMETGIQIEPFFDQTSEPFEINDFYASVLECSRDSNLTSSSEPQESRPFVNLEPAVWFSKLVKDASMREIEKRSAFKIRFKIGDGLEISVSGFVLVVEEKRRGYIVVDPQTSNRDEVKYVTEYIDADSTAVVDKQNIVNYFPIGNEKELKSFRRVIFTNDEVEKIRTLGLDTGLILLGFRPKNELLWKDHVKHSYYIYPNEDEFLGSTRAFSALLHSMARKEKIGYGLLRTRKNDTPALVAILPQLEVFDTPTSTQIQPPGMHLCLLPWADDMNPPPTVTQYDCFTEPGQNKHPAIELAGKIIRKLKVAYAPNNTRNPALQYHYDFLAAKYLNEPFEPAIDQSLPLYSSIQERCGDLIKELKEEIDRDPRAEATIVPTTLSKKRRRIEDGEGVDTEVVESAFASRREKTLTVLQLKEYLIFHKQLSVGGKAPLKAELIKLAGSYIVTKTKGASGTLKA